MVGVGEIKVVDGVRVANYLALKLGDYPGLCVICNAIIREEKGRKISIRVMRFEKLSTAGFEDRRKQ